MRKKILLVLLAVTINVTSCNSKSSDSNFGPNIPDFDIQSPKEKIYIEKETGSEDCSDGISNAEACSNPNYTLFYGEWEISENIYVDSVPVNGVNYSESEMQEAKNAFLQNTNTRKIKFTPNTIIINDNDEICNMIYRVKVFPSDDNYKIHFTMTLKDIGLTENIGSYFVFVEVSTYDNSSIEANNFFVKDKNTIIVYKGSYCIEYKRISYNGGASEPVIISG